MAHHTIRCGALGLAMMLFGPIAHARMHAESEGQTLTPVGRDSSQAEPDPHRGALGPVRLGALLGAGFPSLISGQVVLKLHDWVGLTGSYGATPTLTAPIGTGASFSQQGFAATARVHPFQGMFFLGLGIGRSEVTGRATASAYGVAGEASATTRTTYVLPELGIYRFSFGLTLGADVAVQLPFAGSTSSSSSVAGVAVGLPDDVARTLTALETTPIPVVHFVRIGFVL